MLALQLDRAQRRVADFVAPHLTPNEQIQAILAEALAGLSWLLLIVISVVPAFVVGIFAGAAFGGVLAAAVGGGLAGGATAAILFMTIVRKYALVVTDQRLLLSRRGALTSRPTSIEKAYSRLSVTVVSYRSGLVEGSLRLGLAGEPDLKLSFRRLVRRASEQVMTVLSSRAVA